MPSGLNQTAFLLVSEDLFKGQNLNWSQSPEILRVKILDVTKDAIYICAALHPFLLCGLHILESKCLHSLVDIPVTIL